MTELPDDYGVIMDEHGLPLNTAIAQLRTELLQAIDSGAKERLQFEVESIEIELEIVAKVVKKGEAKLSLWRVLTAGVSKEYTDAAKHRLKLTLAPRDTSQADDTNVRIGDDG